MVVRSCQTQEQARCFTRSIQDEAFGVSRCSCGRVAASDDLFSDEAKPEPEREAQERPPVSQKAVVPYWNSIPFAGLFPPSENQFPQNEIQFPLTEIQFPLTENRFPLTENQFPLTEIQFPLTEIQFPLTEIQFPLTDNFLSLKIYFFYPV